MSSGLLALTKFQATIETSRGSNTAATRIQPLSGFMKHVIDRENPDEDRGTFENYYRTYQTKQHVELAGVKGFASFEDMPWFAQLFVKGSVTGVVSDTSAYTYTFVPTLGTDDLQTATFQVGDDTQAFAIPRCLGNKLEVLYERGKGTVLTMDYLGQQAIETAFTGGLTQRTLEDVKSASTLVYIDPTTIGTTQVTDPITMKLTLLNGWEQIFRLDGNLYSGAEARKRRHLDIEGVLQFDSVAEYDAAVTSPAERKIRIKTTGTKVGAVSVLKTVQWDIYTYWDTFDFGSINGVRTVQFKGRSVYDATALTSWSLTCINGLATLP